jgi:hypothetical protein
VPPTVSIESRASDNVLWLMVLCIAAGGLLLAPSLAWLMWLFKRTPESSPQAAESHQLGRRTD